MDSVDLKASNDEVKMMLNSDEDLLNLNDMGLFNLVDLGDLRENGVTMCIAKNANGLYNSAWIDGGISGNANECAKRLFNSAWKNGGPNETAEGLCNSARKSEGPTEK